MHRGKVPHNNKVIIFPWTSQMVPRQHHVRFTDADGLREEPLFSNWVSLLSKLWTLKEANVCVRVAICRLWPVNEEPKCSLSRSPMVFSIWVTSKCKRKNSWVQSWMTYWLTSFIEVKSTKSQPVEASVFSALHEANCTTDGFKVWAAALVWEGAVLSPLATPEICIFQEVQQGRLTRTLQRDTSVTFFCLYKLNFGNAGKHTHTHTYTHPLRLAREIK